MSRKGLHWPFGKQSNDEEITADRDAEAESYSDETAWAADTHTGRVRHNNEDAYLCDGDRGLFVVADGMGGHVGGEVASAIAVAALDDFLTAQRLDELQDSGVDAWRDLLFQSIMHADEMVRRAGMEQPGLETMGSTAVIAVLRGDMLHVANVGDSRAYLIRDSKPRILSTDHSVAAVVARNSGNGEEDVRENPLRNQLTTCLGGERTAEPEYHAAEVTAGDTVVLCSDGLWDMLSDSEIACIAAGEVATSRIVRDMIAAANSAGGLDNITVVVLKIELRAEA